MDIFNFISELVKSLSWPLSIILIALIFRKPISELIKLISKLKFKDLEIEFNNTLTNLNNKIIKEIPKIKEEKVKSENEENLLKLAEKFPQKAILDSWTNLQSTAIDTLKSYGVEIDGYDYLKISRYLGDNNIFNNNQIEIYNDLHNLRNQAAHLPESSLSSSATDYVANSTTVTEFLKSSKKNDM